jgi:hypothetical protein
MTREGNSSGRFRRPSRLELLLIAVAVLTFFVLYSTLNIEAVNLANSGVRDLETTLIQVNGLLLAFSAVLFAQLLSGAVPREVLNRMSFANEIRILKGLNAVSQALLLRTVAVFLLFVTSLLGSIILLVLALSNPASATSIANAVLIPVAPLVLGISYILIAVGSYLKAQREAVDALGKPGM